MNTQIKLIGSSTLILLLILISGNVWGISKYAHSDIDWATGPWYTAPTGTTTTTKPVAGDIVYTNGYVVTVSTNEVCDYLYLSSTVNAITINAGATLTIKGSLTGSGNITVDAVGGGGTLIFTGEKTTTVITSAIQSNVIFSNITFNSNRSLTSSAYITIDNGALLVQAGTLSTSFPIIGLSNATLTVNSGATLKVNNTISGGNSTNPYPTITIDGTLNINNYIISNDITVNGTLNTGGYISTSTININGSLTTSNYVNSTNFVIGSTGFFYTSYGGGEGWWGSFSPTSMSLDGDVILNGSDQQIASGLVFNNLTVTSTGIKTLSGDITVNGSLNILNDFTYGAPSFNVQSFGIYGSGSINIDDNTTIITSNPNGTDGLNFTGIDYSIGNSANFVFNGTGLQITGNSFPSTINNLTVDNTSTLTLSKSLDCNDITTATDAQLIVPPSIGLTSHGYDSFTKPLILRTSTDANRPIMGTFINYGTVSGQITMEMSYTSNGSAGNTGRGLYFSPPISDATSGIVGANGTTNRLLYVDVVNRKWVEIKDLTTPLTIAKGYLFRSTTSAVYSFTGIPNNNSFYDISNIPRGDSKQFYIAGNPYPAVIDWNAITTKTNLTNTIWYRTSTTSGKMVVETYNGDTGIGSGNNGSANVDGKISPMQGFWVQCSADYLVGDLIIDGNARTHDWGSAQFLKSPRKKSNSNDKDVLRLYLYSGENRDEAIFIQSSMAKDTFDSWDSRKMFSKDASLAEIYSLSPENIVLAIQSVQPVTTSKNIKLGLSVGTAGEYKFVGNFAEALNKTNVFLEDKKVSVIHDLTANPEYTFYSDIVGFNSIPDDTSRFVLHILAKPNLVVNNSISVCTPNTVDLTSESITQGSDAGLIYSYWLDENATIPYSTPSTAETGTYYIKGTASNGSYAIAGPISVVINPSPTVTITNPAPVTEPATVNLTSSEITLGSTEGLIYSYWLDASASIPYSTPQSAGQGNYYIKGTVESTGCYSIAGPVTVVVNPITGIVDLTNDQISIYAIDNQIHILNSKTNSKIFIFDILGNEKYVGIAKSSHQIINTDLKSGLYIVKVSENNKVQSRKVIIR